jgi:hypothetical protein
MLDQNTQPGQAPAYPEQNLPTTTVAEAPVSPDEASGMSQEEMRQNLQDMMAKIDSKYQDFSMKNFSNNTTNQKSKSETLIMFFDMLKQAGVDPSNVEEVNAFLESIKQNNPEIFKQIEAILKTLIEGGDMVPAAEEIPTDGNTPEQPTPEMGATTPQPNMNINTNESPQQNI